MIIDDYYVVSVQDSAAVAALTDKGEIALINQYRYCYDTELIELPSGVFEENEMDPLVVARRILGGNGLPVRRLDIFGCNNRKLS